MSVRRIDATEQAGTIADPMADPDYSSAFELSRPGADGWSPVRWARVTWEDCPRGVRWFLLAGWSVVLGLRLGPRPSPAHVLGWSIVAETPTAIVLAARSGLLVAQNVVLVQDSRVVWTTVVRFQRWPGRLLWSLVAPIHHRMVPRLLSAAAGRVGRDH
ncbi:MAG TPA: DUF2867 domain-containing protein [Pseudonocardiaceae bacterium]|nr:DUF2867 domain-containing protein [Pseudonocardiaceae bacterium]